MLSKIGLGPGAPFLPRIDFRLYVSRRFSADFSDNNQKIFEENALRAERSGASHLEKNLENGFAFLEFFECLSI